jgi:hypothetical protein
MNDGLFFTAPSALGAVLGYLLHLTLSWGEWRKISGNKLGFREFAMNDPPSQIAGILSVIITYLSLPALGEIEWVKAAIGFNLTPNFFSAVIIAFVAQAVAVKLRNISRKINGGDE